MNKKTTSDFRPFLETAGGKISCRRCQARSGRSKLQCGRPAISTSKQSKCQFHGGLSTGPKTKNGKDRIRAAHWKHGHETIKAKADRSKKSLIFLYLTDIGNHCNMFYKQIKTRGRPPLGYRQLDLTDPEQLALAIVKTLGTKKR